MCGEVGHRDIINYVSPGILKERDELCLAVVAQSLAKLANGYNLIHLGY